MTPAFALWVDGGIDIRVGDVSLLVAVWEAASWELVIREVAGSAEYLTKSV